MEITRRQFFVLGGAFTLSGCAPAGDNEAKIAARANMAPVDAGPLARYSGQGIFGQFRGHGFFIIHRGSRLFAQSAVCTHRDCLISPSDSGFKCRCHGSTFTLEGRVTRGPARHDLPRFAVEQHANGHLIVHLESRLTPDQFDLPESYLRVTTADLGGANGRVES